MQEDFSVGGSVNRISSGMVQSRRTFDANRLFQRLQAGRLTFAMQWVSGAREAAGQRVRDINC
jgi:hypothetical protein